MARNKAAFSQKIHERQCAALLKVFTFLMDVHDYTKYDFVDQGINKDTLEKFLESENRKARGEQPININHSSVDKNLGISLKMLMQLRDRLEEEWLEAEDCDSDAAYARYRTCREFCDEIVGVAFNF